MRVTLQLLPGGDVVVNGIRKGGRIAKMIRLLYEHRDEINSGRVDSVELNWDHDKVSGQLVYRDAPAMKDWVHCPDCDTVCCSIGEQVPPGTRCPDCLGPSN